MKEGKGYYSIWAWEQRAGGTSAKSVLMTLDYHEDEETNTCDLTIDEIAQDCEMSRRTAIRSLKKLEQKGIIKIQRRPRMPNLVTLLKSDTPHKNHAWIRR